MPAARGEQGEQGGEEQHEASQRNHGLDQPANAGHQGQPGKSAEDACVMTHPYLPLRIRPSASIMRAASAQVTRALAAVLASLNTQIKALDAQIAAQLASHTDGHIFTSLPRSGNIRAARLLTEIGDCRARFPDPRR